MHTSPSACFAGTSPAQRTAVRGKHVEAYVATSLTWHRCDTVGKHRVMLPNRMGTRRRGPPSLKLRRVRRFRSSAEALA